MARRKSGPPTDMFIEGLSGPSPLGQVGLEPDDFEPSELIPVKVARLIAPRPKVIPHGLTKVGRDARKARVKRDLEAAQTYLDQQKRAHELVKHVDAPEVQMKFVPKANQVQTESELVITVGEIKPNPPWRRL